MSTVDLIEGVRLDHGDAGLMYVPGIGFRPLDGIDIYGTGKCPTVDLDDPQHKFSVPSTDCLSIEKWEPPLWSPPIWDQPPTFASLPPQNNIYGPPPVFTPPVWFPPVWCCSTSTPPTYVPPPETPEVVPLPASFILLATAVFILKRIAS